MKILAIETSCDETAISIVDGNGGFARPSFSVLAHLISSQIAIHKEWGGVVPSIAKREHGKALVPLLLAALDESGLLKATKNEVRDDALAKKLGTILEREPELSLAFFNQIFAKLETPEIEAIAVTYGPGLEPALWVGINFARALSLLWGKPVIPVNHMEGHLYSSLNNQTEGPLYFPAIALLISGGHTEIVLIKDWQDYKVIGRTRDDAVGEAFDKVARLLGLPYPGGPEIAKLAEQFARENMLSPYKLPRPMLNSGDYDFSFSGLKTAVLYLVKKIGNLSEDDKKAIAWEFQNAAIDVLLAKTLKAVALYAAKTVVVGGGVIANRELKNRLAAALAPNPELTLLLPDQSLSTDNATMIAIAAYFRSLNENFSVNPELTAQGNLSL